MIFVPHALPDRLAPFIEAMFHYKNLMPDHSVERVVPTGHLFLLFEMDGIPRNTFHNDSLARKGTFQKVWISGMHKAYLSISAPQDAEMVVVQFKAHGAFPFLHRAVSELNDQVVPAEAVLGKEILALHAELLAAPASQDKFAALEAWLDRRFDAAKTPPPELLAVLGQLQAGTAREFADLAAVYPHSQKHLIAQCKKYVGLTPKSLRRVWRFNEILQRIQQKEKIAWPQVAYQCGFSDQSHFIKDFKAFSGFNPQEFIAESHHKQDPNFFPLDREG